MDKDEEKPVLDDAMEESEELIHTEKPQEERLQDITSHPDQEEAEAPHQQEANADKEYTPSKLKVGLAVFSTILIIICVCVGVILGVGTYALNGLGPTDPSDDPVRIVIAPGTNSHGIADILEENGIIHDARVFTYYLRFKNQGSRFQAGEYEMQPGMTHDEIITKLNRGDTIQEEMIRFTIPEGYTLEQMAARLSSEQLVDEAVFMEILSAPEQLSASVLQYIPDDENLKFPLEGYLFPETYEMKATSSEQDIIERMLNELDNKLSRLSADLESKLETLGISFHEMMTLASLIEREVVSSAERPIVAGVMFNRLEINMPLQIDATVQYALPEHKERLLTADLEIDSPYNTYKIPGIPPGPIASPSLSSIEAVLNPEQHNYFYYVTKKDGTSEHYFAETFAEHQANIRKSNQ